VGDLEEIDDFVAGGDNGVSSCGLEAGSAFSSSLPPLLSPSFISPLAGLVVSRLRAMPLILFALAI
jgi:hypothetical protein